MFTIEPERCFSIVFWTDLVMLKIDLRFTSNTRSKSSSLIRIKRLSFVIPALLTSISIVSKLSNTSFINSSVSFIKEASDLYALAFIPNA